MSYDLVYSGIHTFVLFSVLVPWVAHVRKEKKWIIINAHGKRPGPPHRSHNMTCIFSQSASSYKIHEAKKIVICHQLTSPPWLVSSWSQRRTRITAILDLQHAAMSWRLSTPPLVCNTSFFVSHSIQLIFKTLSYSQYLDRFYETEITQVKHIPSKEANQLMGIRKKTQQVIHLNGSNLGKC